LTGNNISGVILAGGSNKRFGGITKANVEIDGLTIISRIISVIGEIFPEIIIVTNSPDEFSELRHYKLIADEYLNAGPLGGIHAALKSSSKDAIFVFAGDMPFINNDIITEQIVEFWKGNHDIIIPKIGQLIEPLHAIYRKSILMDLENFMSEKRNKAVRDFLTKVNVEYLQMQDTERCKKAFTNINSPSDMLDITS
jgi:molybdenum cofactor guanylyltransferase